jgi:lipid-A-disaccharide synthase-like uncharacterized protein
MKPGPIVAMVALIAVGIWLVLQPTLARDAFDYEVRVGGERIAIAIDQRDGSRVYNIVSPPHLTRDGLSAADLLSVLDAETAALAARPRLERTLLGFLNISSWMNFIWIAIGLVGQGAFFGRMFVQWIVSEKTRQSQVPEIFWWLSLVGGMSLFTYFVWRVDIVGVIGQSTGIVIYARNLRLIAKAKRRQARTEPPLSG